MDEVEITTPDSSSEEQIAEEISSDDSEVESEDNAPEEADTEVSQPEHNSARAETRIRETIARAKQAEARAMRAEQALQAFQSKNQPAYEGIDETGIDPQKYGESVVKMAEQRAASAADRQIQVLRAEADFPEVKTNRVVQALAKGYVVDGYSPYEAAQMASDDYQELRAGETENLSKRKEADSAIRRTTYSPRGNDNKRSEHIFTEAEIAAMDKNEYDKNFDKIIAQMSKNLIK